jgi:EAL domain-containing protein (putative c-di-GMP-specific phosphodiesterase class I)
MDEVLKHRRMIEEELRLALELGNQLKLVYQPLFSADAKRIVGAEALVRWEHPTNGRMEPDMFIGIAEERGLIEQLGEFVLREAAAYALRTNLPWVAVNVSPLQFRSSGFASKVLAILKEIELEPSRLPAGDYRRGAARGHKQGSCNAGSAPGRRRPHRP